MMGAPLVSMGIAGRVTNGEGGRFGDGDRRKPGGGFRCGLTAFPADVSCA